LNERSDINLNSEVEKLERIYNNEAELW